MTDPTMPINVAAIESRSALDKSVKRLAQQVGSQDRLEESESEAFNPGAAEKEQAKYNRFRPLDNRKKTEGEAKKIQAVKEKAEEDLANRFQQNRNPELSAKDLRALLRNLRDQFKPGMTAAEILAEVNRNFKDPTLAHEAMDYLLETTEGELKSTIEEAKSLHYSLKEREIIAGRNVDAAAKLFHKKGLGESTTELRDLYRQITGTPYDHNTLFDELAEKYPFDQLKLVVAYLLKGLGFDLKKGPSIQQGELIRLMTEVRNLQSILWVFYFFKNRIGLMRMMFSQYGVPYAKILSFETLAKQFIKLVEEKYPTVLKLLKQLEKMGVLDDISKIVVLTQYRDAIRGLAPRLYRSLKHRQDLLLIIYETLEDLEDEEEEEQKEPDPKRRKKSP